MSPKAQPSFLARVRAALPRLHPTERRLADFVLSFPGELASYTATELARLANVSNATVTRFVRKIGYAGYEEARQHVRAERQTGAALYRVAASGAEAGDLVVRHAEQGAANLEQTLGALSLEEIDALAEALLTVRRVWIVGFRSGAAFAQYLAWQILQVVERVSLIPGPGETLGEHLAGIGAEDCVVVFGLRRRPAKLEAILDQIVRSGARIAYVTDESLAPDRRVSWHLRCQTAAPGPLFSHVSVMGLCHLLATRVIERAGQDGRRRLTAIESLHDALDEL
ncbi:MurR/RpiR family transcriptional regulator [Salinarimonas sp.]|uniref:MurR/RpiR family transcriptional regulator n=1 Tax=Salinarimonas sp. TaxID=2766526 RepID=UPI0032D90729